MPILMITPDMMAETWLGALAWAPGSQTCSGMMPALRPKPTRRERRSPSPCRGRDGSIQRREGERAGGRPQQGEEGEEAERADVRRDQVDQPASRTALLVVFGGDQEEGRERHDLPAEQEQHAVAGDHEQSHAGGQRAVEEPQLAAVLRMFGLLPIAQAINVSQQRDQEDRYEEDGRQSVHGHVELGTGKEDQASTMGWLSPVAQKKPTPARPVAAPRTASKVVSHWPAEPIQQEAG